MNESDGVRWVGHYDEIAEADRPGVSDHFVNWKDVDGELGVETIGFTLSYLEPGGSGPMHSHDDPVEEVWFILTGTVEVETPETSFTAGPGAIAFFEPGVKHRPVNDADEVAVVLSCKTKLADGSVRARIHD